MQEYSFNSLVELDAILSNIDITVPLRSQGRKTEHTERYSIVSFLSQFKTELFKELPVKLVHSDKPDFRIFTPYSTIGIEVTEAIPEQLARASYLCEINFPNGGKIEPQFFGWDSPERTNDEIIEILKRSNKQLFGKPSYGYSIENCWMQGIHSCINNKIQKLNKNNFEKYNRNWLLIYDNQTKAFFNNEYFLENFPILIKSSFEKAVNHFFNRIIIDSSNYFYIVNYQNTLALEIITKNVG